MIYMKALDVLQMLVDEFDGSIEDLPFDPVLQKRLKLGAVLGLLLDAPSEHPHECYSQAIPLLVELHKGTRNGLLATSIFDLVMSVNF